MVILVTGCRSGFGLSIAVAAARRGHTVYAGLRDLSTDGALREATTGLPVIPIQLDITDPTQRADAVARILREQGRIDALVNNAGIAVGGFLEMVDEDELRRVFETNVFATWALTRAVLPAMRAQKRGVIVQISSMSGRMALPGLGVYAASKHALEGLSEAWRHELRRFGVRVVLVEPGAYKTDIWTRNRTLTRRADDADSPYAHLVHRMDDRFRQLSERDAGDPMEVGEKVVDLCEADWSDLRFPMGKWARTRQLMLTLAPFPLLERALARMMALEE